MFLKAAAQSKVFSFSGNPQTATGTQAPCKLHCEHWGAHITSPPTSPQVLPYSCSTGTAKQNRTAEASQPNTGATKHCPWHNSQAASSSYRSYILRDGVAGLKAKQVPKQSTPSPTRLRAMARTQTRSSEDGSVSALHLAPLDLFCTAPCPTSSTAPPKPAPTLGASTGPEQNIAAPERVLAGAQFFPSTLDAVPLRTELWCHQSGPRGFPMPPAQLGHLWACFAGADA